MTLMDKKFYRKTKYFDYSLFLLAFPIFINGCENGLTTPDNKKHSTNIAKNINKHNFKIDNKILLIENSSNNNKSIQTNDDFIEVIVEKKADLDMDGDSDIISVTKPNGQDVRNFDVKISVYQMVGEKASLWQQNTLMFKDPINGCIMDGLEDITTSSGKFTIEYTSCYDNKYARRFVSFSYNPQSNDFKITKNTISFLEPESYDLNQIFDCRDNEYLFSSYDDSCEWW